MKKVLLLTLGLFLFISGCAKPQGYFGKRTKNIYIDVSDNITNINAKDIETLIDQSELNATNIALLIPLSGKYSSIGEEILNSVQIAVANSKNDKINLLIYNTEGDPKKAVSDIKSALKSYHISAIIGPLLSSTTKAIIPVVKDNIPIISLSNDINVALNQDNVFTLGFTPYVSIARTVDYLYNNKDAKNIVAFLPDNNYGNTLETSLKMASDVRNDMSIIRIIKYDPKKAKIQEDIANIISDESKETYLNQIKKVAEAKTQNEPEVTILIDGKYTVVNTNYHPQINPDFDTIFIGGSIRDSLLVGAHLAALDINLKDVIIFGTPIWSTGLVGSESLMLGAYFATIDNSSFVPYNNIYMQYFNKSSSQIASAAYDAFMMLDSMVSSDSKDKVVYNHISLNNILKYQTYNGAGGAFKFNEDGIAIRNLTIARAYRRYNKILNLDNSINLSYIKNHNIVDYYNNSHKIDLIKNLQNELANTSDANNIDHINPIDNKANKDSKN